jgi:hypothetical protein
MERENNLVVFRNYGNPLLAQFHKACLEENGIPCMIKDLNFNFPTAFYSDQTAGIKLLVMNHDLQSAFNLLSDDDDLDYGDEDDDFGLDEEFGEDLDEDLNFDFDDDDDDFEGDDLRFDDKDISEGFDIDEDMDDFDDESLFNDDDMEDDFNFEDEDEEE